MQLEDYFDFLLPNDIRLKGTRIGIETILYDFIHKKRSPEEIAQTYPTLNLEQVYATILYYLQNQEEVDNYMINWLAHGYRMRSQQRLNPLPATLRLHQLRNEREEIKQKDNAEIFTI